MNTGYQRSLTISVTMKINGITMPGYPLHYQGRNSFTWDGITYPEISTEDMSAMDITDFNDRLAAFKLYVESIESTLSVDTDVVAGKEARVQNLTACPI